MSSRRIDDIVDAIFMDSALTYDGRNTTETTMALTGSGWLYTDSLTLTASASYFAAGDVGNEIHITDSNGDVLRCRITAYTSATVVTVKPHKTVPVALRTGSTTNWAKAVDTISGLGHLEGEDLSIKPWSFGLDAIGRERVSNPLSLIDADFEYGLQNTKWQNVATTNNIPNFYEDVGIDIVYNTDGYTSLISGDDLITSNIDTAVRLSNPGTPTWVADDFALVHSQTVGNTTALVSGYLTSNINSSADRTFNLNTSNGLSAGDLVLIIQRPTSGGTTLASANITSNATTTVNCANASGILDGSYIIVETDTANVYETMAVTNVSGNALTVVRQTNNTNGSAANITIGNDIYPVSTVEIASVFQVSSNTQIQVQRGWYNIPAANSLPVGTVVQR
jgi:hypothetical protein